MRLSLAPIPDDENQKITKFALRDDGSNLSGGMDKKGKQCLDGGGD